MRIEIDRDVPVRGWRWILTSHHGYYDAGFSWFKLGAKISSRFAYMKYYQMRRLALFSRWLHEKTARALTRSERLYP